MELAIWLEETIVHICDRPEMYAQTLNELDLTLYTHHFIWGLIDERNWAGAHFDLLRGNYQEVLQSEVERHRVIEFAERDRLKIVIDHWKEVDARIGLGSRKATG